MEYRIVEYQSGSFRVQEGMPYFMPPNILCWNPKPIYFWTDIGVTPFGTLESAKEYLKGIQIKKIHEV